MNNNVSTVLFRFNQCSCNFCGSLLLLLILVCCCFYDHSSPLQHLRRLHNDERQRDVHTGYIAATLHRWEYAHRLPQYYRASEGDTCAILVFVSSPCSKIDRATVICLCLCAKEGWARFRRCRCLGCRCADLRFFSCKHRFLLVLENRTTICSASGTNELTVKVTFRHHKFHVTANVDVKFQHHIAPIVTNNCYEHHQQ